MASNKRRDGARGGRRFQQDARQKEALEHLRSYLLGYCRRYGRRLSDPDFVSGLNPQAIFQNHFILSQVIREFSSRANTVFSQADLDRCFWWVWAPLIWPQIVSFDGTAALLSLLKKHQQGDIVDAWQNSNMPIMAVIMLSEAIGTPPSWRPGIWEKPASVNSWLPGNG